MSKKINCGIIGVGWWGAQMSDFILKSKVFNIKALYDSNLERASHVSKNIGCGFANNLDDLLSDNSIECIFIFSPNEFHVEHALRVAKAKKHVFVEKPLANTSFESIKIAEACKENGVILAIGHNVRFYSIFKEAKKIINEGVIGDIIYIDGNRSRPIGYSIDEKSWRYYSDKCNGGPLIQMAIHIFDTVRFVCDLKIDEIKKVSVKEILKTQNDESFGVLIRFNRYKLLHVFSSYIAQESFYLNFFGTKGSLYVDVFNGLFLQKSEEFKKRRIKYHKNHPEVDEIKSFYESIINSNGSSATVTNAIENVDLIEKILASK
jgi:predicted dehydrogenase